jgi:hypothetical protein
MGIREKIEQLKSQNGWIKSPLELDMEIHEFKLFSNIDYGFFSTPEDIRKIYEEAESFLTDRGLEYNDDNVRTLNRAYDDTCFQFTGKGIYLRAPELVIPDRVVIRDWKTLVDKPYSKDISDVLKHLSEIDGIKK